MSAERDLATAIYREITQPERVIDALEVWRNPQSRSWTEFDRMAFVLCRISAAAIDRVLARRQSEAARDPGRWEPDRDALGRLVRDAWIRWARTQPSPKASWLVPYDELSEPDKEADRQIGEAIRRAARAPGRWDGSILAGTNRDDTP